MSYPHLGLVVEAPDAGLSQTLLLYRVLPNGTIEPLTSEPRALLSSPSEFRDELESVVGSNLRFTLRRLEQEAKAPYEATVRTRAPATHAVNDTKVRLSRPDFERLAAPESRTSTRRMGPKFWTTSLFVFTRRGPLR